MLTIAFTAEEIWRLGYERYPHRHPRVQRRMAMVYLKALGLPHQEISRVAGVGGNTLRRYWRAYQAGGIERFKEIPVSASAQRVVGSSNQSGGVFSRPSASECQGGG
jgi:hypothetical protein